MTKTHSIFFLIAAPLAIAGAGLGLAACSSSDDSPNPVDVPSGGAAGAAGSGAAGAAGGGGKAAGGGASGAGGKAAGGSGSSGGKAASGGTSGAAGAAGSGTAGSSGASGGGTAGSGGAAGPGGSGGAAGGNAGTGGTAGGSGGSGGSGDTGGTSGSGGSGGVAGGTSGSGGTGGSAATGGSGGGTGGSGPVITTIASFDPKMGQLPEGLVERPAAGGGAPDIFVSFAAAGEVVIVAPDGTFKPFGSLPTPPSMAILTGLAFDPGGALYAGLAAFGQTPSPTPGIYKFPAGGGTATLFSTSSSPPMVFANGLVFVGPDLYVADSTGVIFKVDSTGAATAWSTDTSYVGDKTACGGNGQPFSIGANDIIADASNLYFTVTDLGEIVKLPIKADGSAGTPVILKQDCAIHGADGIVMDTDGSFFVALTSKNAIAHVAVDGTISTVASGAPFDFPTSLAIDTVAGKRRLLIENAAYTEALNPASPTPGMPSLLSLPLP